MNLYRCMLLEQLVVFNRTREYISAICVREVSLMVLRWSFTCTA